MENDDLSESFFNIQDEIKFLSEFLPSVLSEGAIAVELKKELYQGQDIKILLTLEETQCDLISKPADLPDGVWAWSLSLNRWYHLKYTSIDTFETWPPSENG